MNDTRLRFMRKHPQNFKLHTKIKPSSSLPVLSNCSKIEHSNFKLMVFLHEYNIDLKLTHDMAAMENFLSNLVAYAKYFFTVMLGTTYMMTKPIISLFNTRTSGLLALCGIVGLVYFIYFTLSTMLGLTDIL